MCFVQYAVASIEKFTCLTVIMTIIFIMIITDNYDSQFIVITIVRKTFGAKKFRKVHSL